MKTRVRGIPNQRLRNERLRHHWSQQELADRIGTTIANISRWERGVTSPGPHFSHQLCELFGKSSDDLGLLQAVHDPSTKQLSDAFPSSEEASSPDHAGEDVSVRWHVPYHRNLFFTGREHFLTRLHATLHTHKAGTLTNILAVSGLGGIGKTQTVLEYAYRFRNSYAAVLWARAETRDLLIADFMSIAGMLRLPEGTEQKQDQAVDAVKRWLGHHTDWLLILDNVEDVSLVYDFIPADITGHILLTTRAQSIGTIAPCIDLALMGLEEGALLLLRRAKLLAPDMLLHEANAALRQEAYELCERMDRLPLAIDQAGAYIEETGCSLSDYLALYQSQCTRLLSIRGASKTNHPQSVSATLQLAIQQVEQKHAASVELLRLCTFLHPDFIPEELIREGAAMISAMFNTMVTDLLSWNEALAALRAYSLLRRNPDTKALSLHRLVQAVLRDGLSAEEQRQWVERTIQTVNAVFPDATVPTSWQRCQRYLPQALACVSLIEQWRILSPEAGRLLDQTGVYLLACAQYDHARSLLNRALEIRMQIFHDEHPDVANSLSHLATLYCTLGNYAQAEPLYRRALAICEKSLGSEHPDVAINLNDLAVLCFYQGQYEQAEPLYRRALALQEQSLPPEHPAIAASLNNLAEIYLAQEQYEQAEPLYRRALELHEQSLGPDHPMVAKLLCNLARFYTAQNNHDRAEPLMQRALKIREKALEPEHPDIAINLNNLATLYKHLKKYEQAEQFYRRALAIQEKTPGPKHPHTALTLNNLAQLYRAQERYAQAEPLYRRALAIQEQTSGSEHPYTAIVLSNLARLYMAQEQYEQARPLMQRALTIQEKVLGSEHSRTVQSRQDLAMISQMLTKSGKKSHE